jgi:3-deoxy-7-phosphoheptulonate synthase
MKSAHPLTSAAWATVATARTEMARILLGEDPRLLAVVGPCSIHDVTEIRRYAALLAPLAAEIRDQILVVLRFCGDKPRTGRAWTGFWNDPHMDGSCDIVHGWSESRKLAIEILDMGLPLGFEFLDAENFQRLDDLPSYVWIGARDVGSQRQRQVASGISAPVGFKNHNAAGVAIAVDAISVAVGSNVFVASNDHGKSSRYVTAGNRLSHLVHRGTDAGTNYDAESIAASARELLHRGLLSRVVVDVSHGNSRKNCENQADVISQVVGQVVSGSAHIAGVMYESYLKGGMQLIPKDLSELLPEISVTDGCDGWDRTETALRDAHRRLSQR